MGTYMGAKKKFISQEYSAESGGKNLREGTRQARGWTVFAASFFSVAVVVGVCLVSFTIVFFYSEVIGKSMMTTLNASGADSDSVIVNRYAKAEQGNIIVKNHYDAEHKFLELHIKRFIADGDKGDTVCFDLVDSAGEPVDYEDRNTTRGKSGHYELQVNGIDVDAGARWQGKLLGNNARGITYYDNIYEYLHTGVVPSDPSCTISDYFPYRRDRNDAHFNTHYDSGDGVMVPFRKQVAKHGGRYEFVLPKGYFFYMGDNRGGQYSTHKISLDATYYGPQPKKDIVGVVSEIIEYKDPGKWFTNKLAYLFSFKWLVGK